MIQDEYELVEVMHRYGGGFSSFGDLLETYRRFLPKEE